MSVETRNCGDQYGVCGDFVHANKTGLESVVIRNYGDQYEVFGDCMHADKTKLETTRMKESAQDTNDIISPWVQGNILGRRPL